jgi:hypothetical protein
MSKFKASDYNVYNSKFGFDKYKQLYDLMQELFNLLPFDEKDFENDTCFKYKNLNCFVDKENGSYCEVIGSGWFSLSDRVIIHKKVMEKISERLDRK